jgi:hypothetical protein
MNKHLVILVKKLIFLILISQFENNKLPIFQQDTPTQPPKQKSKNIFENM